MPRAQDLITQAYQQVILQLPALDKLKLVIRLELRGRGDVQVFRVRTPGPEVVKEDPNDARLDISISRSHFNELAADGKLKNWHDAFEHGHVRIGGDPAVIKLLGSVIERHEARAQFKRGH